MESVPNKNLIIKFYLIYFEHLIYFEMKYLTNNLQTSHKI